MRSAAVLDCKSDAESSAPSTASASASDVNAVRVTGIGGVALKDQSRFFTPTAPALAMTHRVASNDLNAKCFLCKRVRSAVRPLSDMTGGGG